MATRAARTATKAGGPPHNQRAPTLADIGQFALFVLIQPILHYFIYRKIFSAEITIKSSK